MGLPSIVKDKWFGRKRKVTYEDPPRTIVFVHDLRSFNHWCHVHGVHPNDPRVIFITTAEFRPETIQGYRFRPQDTFVVLETAPYGQGWSEYCREVLLRTGGWVDLQERKEHFI